MNAEQRNVALSILEDHFRGLNAYDRYRSTGAFVPTLLKRLAAGLDARQIAVLFGEELAHINYPTFRTLFEQLDALERLLILETGSSAHGTNSSTLFARLICRLGGTFHTVDIDPIVSANARRIIAQVHAEAGSRPEVACAAFCSDSIRFLASVSGHYSLVYLDSYDLIPGRFVESERHGLAEFRALVDRELLDPACALILVDDTPRSVEILATQVDERYLVAAREHVARFGRLPGKGALIREQALADPRFELLAWEYQLLLRYSAREGRLDR